MLQYTHIDPFTCQKYCLSTAQSAGGKPSHQYLPHRYSAFTPSDWGVKLTVKHNWYWQVTQESATSSLKIRNKCRTSTSKQSSCRQKATHTHEWSFYYTTSSNCDKIVYFVFQAHHVRKGGNLDGKDHIQEPDQTTVKKKLRAASYHCNTGFAEDKPTAHVVLKHNYSQFTWVQVASTIRARSNRVYLAWDTGSISGHSHQLHLPLLHWGFRP